MNIGTGLKLRMAGVGLATLASVGFAPGSQAAEAEYSGTFCMTSKPTVLESNPDVTTLVFDAWGIQTPNSTFKPWENATMHCVGYMRIMAGKTTARGSCRWVDAAGDTFTGEYEDAPDMPGKWTFLTGTGKWKGIQGSGTYKVVSYGKPAAPGTSQLCREHSGKYILP